MKKIYQQMGQDRFLKLSLPFCLLVELLFAYSGALPFLRPEEFKKFMHIYFSTLRPDLTQEIQYGAMDNFIPIMAMALFSITIFIVCWHFIVYLYYYKKRKWAFRYVLVYYSLGVFGLAVTMIGPLNILGLIPTLLGLLAASFVWCGLLSLRKDWRYEAS